jgi:hypothetical protein
MYIHSLIYIASLWSVAFPGSMICLAMIFKRMREGNPPAEI